jgi:hypothetical protein
VPFSLCRLEVVNEVRCSLPNYPLLRRELKQLEFIELGRAPDHPAGGTKDVADAVAGAVGYLSRFGHAELRPAESVSVPTETVIKLLDLPPTPNFMVEGDDEDEWRYDGPGRRSISTPSSVATVKRCSWPATTAGPNPRCWSCPKAALHEGTRRRSW